MTLNNILNNIQIKYVSSNFIKHENYSLLTNDNRFYKIYKNLNIYEDSVYRFNLAQSFENELFKVPNIIYNSLEKDTGIIELEYITPVNNILAKIDLLDFYYKVINHIELFKDKSEHLINYELMDDYNKLFPCTKMTLSHGDLHRGNLLRDHYITDWDNLSYKNKRIDIAYTVFIYLSDILHDSNYSENSWKTAIDNVERLYGTESLFDAYKIGSEKIIISVKESHISSFKKTVTKIFNSIS